MPVAHVIGLWSCRAKGGVLWDLLTETYSVNSSLPGLDVLERR